MFGGPACHAGRQVRPDRTARRALGFRDRARLAVRLRSDAPLRGARRMLSVRRCCTSSPP